MLPVISEEVATTAFNEIFEDMPEWRKKMIHYIKKMQLDLIMTRE